MAKTAEELLREQQQNYFLLSNEPGKVTVVVLDPLREFPAFFTNSYLQNNKDKAHARQQKRVPRLTCFTDDAAGLKNGDVLNFSSKNYTVSRVTDDQTPGVYQAVIWLL